MTAEGRCMDRTFKEPLFGPFCYCRNQQPKLYLHGKKVSPDAKHSEDLLGKPSDAGYHLQPF